MHSQICAGTHIHAQSIILYWKIKGEEKKKEKAKHEEEENQKGTASNKPSKNLTILVVEDNSDLRLYLNSVLEEKYNVLLAEDCEIPGLFLFHPTTFIPPMHLTNDNSGYFFRKFMQTIYYF